jgi:hypothetical protein
MTIFYYLMLTCACTYIINILLWRFPSPVGFLPPDLALDWELDSDEGMNLSLAILEAIGELPLGS